MRKIYISAPSEWDVRELAGYIRRNLSISGFEVLEHYGNLSWDQETETFATTQINKCDIFLCYSDAYNPNVMFELGYALGANKRIVLIGDAKTIPPDLRNTLYIRRGASPLEIVEHLERFTELDVPPPFEYSAIDQNPIETIEALARRADWLSSVEPREFEELIGRWFLFKGFDVKLNSHGRDRGYDFAITCFKGERALVEVKKYKQTSQVPVSTIRQLVGSMAIENAKYGIIVSSAPFTQAAQYFASEIGQDLLLLTLGDIDNMKKFDRLAIEHSIKGQ